MVYEVKPYDVHSNKKVLAKMVLRKMFERTKIKNNKKSDFQETTNFVHKSFSVNTTS